MFKNKAAVAFITTHAHLNMCGSAAVKGRLSGVIEPIESKETQSSFISGNNL